MKFNTKILEHGDEYFKSSTIYTLTENLILAKMFSLLSSNQSAFGTYIEKNIYYQLSMKEIELKDVDTTDETIFKIKRRTMIGDKIADIIIVDKNLKTFILYEMKAKADKCDTKKIDGEIEGHNKMQKILEKEYPEYTILSKRIVSILPSASPGNKPVWLQRGATIIEGKEFCDTYGISYESIMEELKSNIKYNQEIVQQCMN